MSEKLYDFDIDKEFLHKTPSSIHESVDSILLSCQLLPNLIYKFKQFLSKFQQTSFCRNWHTDSKIYMEM